MGVQKRERPTRGGKDPREEARTKPQRWEQRLGTRSPSSETLETKTVLKSQMRREGMEAERDRRRTNPGRGRKERGGKGGGF